MQPLSKGMKVAFVAIAIASLLVCAAAYGATQIKTQFQYTATFTKEPEPVNLTYEVYDEDGVLIPDAILNEVIENVSSTHIRTFEFVSTSEVPINIWVGSASADKCDAVWTPSTINLTPSEHGFMTLEIGNFTVGTGGYSATFNVMEIP